MAKPNKVREGFRFEPALSQALPLAAAEKGLADKTKLVEQVLKHDAVIGKYYRAITRQTKSSGQATRRTQST